MTEIVYLLLEAKADLSVKIDGDNPNEYWHGKTPFEAANSDGNRKLDLANILKLYMM